MAWVQAAANRGTVYRYMVGILPWCTVPYRAFFPVTLLVLSIRLYVLNCTYIIPPRCCSGAAKIRLEMESISRTFANGILNLATLMDSLSRSFRSSKENPLQESAELLYYRATFIFAVHFVLPVYERNYGTYCIYVCKNADIGHVPVAATFFARPVFLSLSHSRTCCVGCCTYSIVGTISIIASGGLIFTTAYQ